MQDMNTISDTLFLADNGVWYTDELSEIHYPSDGNNNLFTIEDRSFWFQHRNKCITTVVKKFPPSKNGYLFDIGGGNGFVSSALSKNGFSVVLVEPGIHGIHHARQRGITNLVCATFEKSRFKNKSLSAIGLFDVLEHVEDDLSFLHALKASLIDQGRLYITVPAYQFLWSREDIDAGHFRRYTLKKLSTLLEQMNFIINYASYIFRPLPLPIFLLRSLPYRLGLSSETLQHLDRDHKTQPGKINQAINRILRAELAHIENTKVMRFGGSCLIVATKT
jgi:SAM-dependent methyltransferase